LALQSLAVPEPGAAGTRTTIFPVLILAAPFISDAEFGCRAQQLRQPQRQPACHAAGAMGTKMDTKRRH